MSSTATARRRVPARPPPGVFLDLAVAAILLAATLAVLSHGGVDAMRAGVESDPSRAGLGNVGPLAFALAAGSTVPVVAWRRFPTGAFVTTAVATVLLVGVGHPLDLALGPAVALYLLVASRSRGTSWTRFHTGATVGLLAAYLAAIAAAQGRLPTVEFLHTGLAWAVAWFAGERARLRRERMADLRQRALRAEREAERELLLARAEERARIARDLHDSAGHAISVIAVRAGAARLRHKRDPHPSLPTLEAIEKLARQTVDEIDQIVGVLREEGPPGGPVEAPAGLASLETLVASHAAAALEVTVTTSGTPRTIDGAAGRAAYRILQEALTNAARHGAGTAEVELAYRSAALELTVTNPVAAHDSPPAASRTGGGHGLVGMRERAALLGGSVETRRCNGAFMVHARIPYGEHRP